ncbi:ABC transporter ATP-binding protein [Streptococcus catagoni]|uniref:ABC transporter ATP-binding protein n=1 Tax=Streptococcus catagoni TaxID=2654874 RepID=UPI00140E7A9A|nr:ATP-binding cassette domain-containing protein [Streptococcus catagoni]
MIDCRHVTKYYQKKLVLKDCHFCVKEGEILGIMGESGSGKSTLARLLVGLENPTSGQMLFQGDSYSVKKQGAQIFLVFQDALHAVNPLFTVENILYEGPKSQIARSQMLQLLLDVGLDQTILSKKANELSGGQLQRVCIARAILLKPKLIIFDEALSGLDAVIQGKLLKLLYDLKKKYYLTYIFISHDFHLCQAICHRLLVMSEGQMVDEIRDFQRPIAIGHPATGYLLAAAGERYSTTY